MSAYDDLMAYTRDTMALGQTAGRLGWDQETVMPRGATAQRADEIAAIEAVLHARRSDPKVGEWLEQAEAVWKRAFLLISLNSQEMLDEAFH